jgi:hypothetical protein
LGFDLDRRRKTNNSCAEQLHVHNPIEILPSRELAQKEWQKDSSLLNDAEASLAFLALGQSQLKQLYPERQKGKSSFSYHFPNWGRLSLVR